MYVYIYDEDNYYYSSYTIMNDYETVIKCWCLFLLLRTGEWIFNFFRFWTVDDFGGKFWGWKLYFKKIIAINLTILAEVSRRYNRDWGLWVNYVLRGLNYSSKGFSEASKLPHRRFTLSRELILVRWNESVSHYS